MFCYFRMLCHPERRHHRSPAVFLTVSRYLMRKNKETIMFSSPFVGVKGGKNRESQVIIKSAYPQVYSAGHSLVRKLLPQILNKQSRSENWARRQVSPPEQLTTPQPLLPQSEAHKASPRGVMTYLHLLKTHRRGHFSRAQRGHTPHSFCASRDKKTTRV